ETFLGIEAPELAAYEETGLAFDRGLLLSDPEAPKKLVPLSHGADTLSSVARLFGQILLGRFDNFEEWVKLLPNDEIAEDCSRSTIHLMLSGVLNEKSLPGYEPSPLLMAFLEPLNALTSSLAELIPSEIITDQFASLVSATKELKGKLHKAASARKIEEADSELPALLAWDRYARILHLVDERVEICARLADLLPADHPRRLAALQTIADLATDDKFREIRFRAYWLLWTQFATSQDAIEKAWEIAKSFGYDRVRGIVFHALSETVSGDRLEALSREVDPALLQDETLKVPLDQMENLPDILKGDDLSGGNMVDFNIASSSDTPMDDALCQADGELLTELAYTLEKPVWYLEAGRLFLLADNKGAARAALEDFSGDHVHKSLLLLSLAFLEKNAQEAYEHALVLQSAGSALPGVLAMELGYFTDTLPDEAALAGNRDYALSVGCDCFARRQDWDGLLAWLRELGESCSPPYKALWARLEERSDPALAYEIYESLKETDALEYVLLSQIRCSYLLQDMDKTVTAAAALREKTGEEWLALSLMRLGQPLEIIPLTPLASWFAADRGLMTREEAAAFLTSPSLKARFYMDHLLETGAPLTEEIRQLAPESPEWLVLERIRADYLEPEPLGELLGTWAMTPLSRWWYGKLNGEDSSLDLAVLDAMREKKYETAPVEALDELLPGRGANHIAILRTRSLPDGFTADPATERFLAMLGKSDSAAACLERELTETVDRAPLETLRLLFSGTPGDVSPTMVSAWYQEAAEHSLPDLCAALFDELGEEQVSWLAFRAAVSEEIATGIISSALLDMVPLAVRSTLSLRQALLSSDPTAIAEHYDALPEETWEQACIKALTAQLGALEEPRLFEKSDSPLARILLFAALWRKEDWTRLNTLLLSSLTEEADESVKSHVYKTMALIDGEGKGDEESEMYSREALASFDHPDLYNLLRIMGYNRRTRQLQDELKAFRKLVLFTRLDEQLPGVSAELWCLDELSGLTLPDAERVLSVLEMCPSEGPLLWWAFSHLKEKFPQRFLADYFQDLPDSHYLFSLAHVRQLAEAEQFSEALEILARCAEIRPGFLPLIDLGISMAVKQRSGADFARYINILAEHFTPEEGVSHCYYLSGMALEQWSELKEEAALQYERVLLEAPGHREAFLRLYDIYSKGEQYPKLAALLEHRIEVEEAPENRRRYLKDLGEIYLDHIGSEEEGLETYMKYLEEVPYEKEVLVTVCDILDKLNERPLLIQFLEQFLRYEKKPQERAALFLRAAKAHDDLGNTDDAINIYIKSLEIDQSQQKVWERLYQLYLEKKDFNMSLRSLKRCITLEQSILQQAEYMILLGALYEDGIKDKRNAQASFLKAMEISSGSLGTVRALSEFFDRQNDQVSKNIKLDMLWSKTHKTLEKSIKGEALNTIAHLLMFKGDKRAAQLLAESAHSLGVSRDVLPVEPSEQPISGEILHHRDLTPFLYPAEVKNCHRNILHLIMPEIPRVAKELFDVKPPDKKTLLESRPSGLDDLIAQFNTPFETHHAEGNTLIVVPFETPVIFVGEEFLNVKEYKKWQALLGGTLVMYERGDITALNLSAEKLFHLYAAIALTGFPQRDIAGFDSEQQADSMKMAAKILNKIDKNRYQSLILEMDSITLEIAQKVKKGFALAADRASYLFTGQMGPFADLMIKQSDGQERLDDLTRYVFSTQHFKLRENAVFISMSS
ncbi:hypothetical protein KJ865_01995, partial [Myxococcota bacterium]|nr:hypothetical protein [Myxococcota bacterium]